MDPTTREKLKRIITGNLERSLEFSLSEMDDDKCVIRMPASGNALNAIENVHGGAITALVDTAATGAAWAREGLTREARGATVSLTVNFIAAAKGEWLIADARVKRRGRSMVFLEVDVTGSDGNAVAQGLVTYKLDPNDRRNTN